MGAFGRLFGSRKSVARSSAPASKDAKQETMRHLSEFVTSRPGCEGFIEPPTPVTQTTLVVVAGTGEWTRRKVPDAQAAKALGKKLGIPVFDVNLSGYPSRMREWDQRQRKGRA